MDAAIQTQVCTPPSAPLRLYKSCSARFGSRLGPAGGHGLLQDRNVSQAPRYVVRGPPRPHPDATLMRRSVALLILVQELYHLALALE